MKDLYLTLIKMNKPSELFLNFLRTSNTEISSIYYSLFSLQESKELDDLLEYYLSLSEGNDDYFKEYGKEEWFAIFHKSIRQTDFFLNCFIRRKKKLLTPDEEKQFKFINHKVNKKDYKKYDENGVFFTEEYRFYLDLWERRRRETIEDNISGKLDSILWNTIYLDKDNFLYKTFVRTFTEIKLNKDGKQVSNC